MMSVNNGRKKKKFVFTELLQYAPGTLPNISHILNLILSMLGSRSYKTKAQIRDTVKVRQAAHSGNQSVKAKP